MTRPLVAEESESGAARSARGGLFEPTSRSRRTPWRAAGRAPTPAITSLIADRKRGPKRGPTPWSKTIPTDHNPSQGSRGTRGDKTPRPARNSGVWRAKELVDRGRIALPTPGFSVPWSGDGRRTETAGPGQDSSSSSPARIAVSPGGGRACRSSAGGSSRPTSSRSPLQRAAGLVDTCWLFSTADCAGHDLSAWMRAIPGLTTRDQTSRCC